MMGEGGDERQVYGQRILVLKSFSVQIRTDVKRIQPDTGGDAVTWVSRGMHTGCKLQWACLYFGNCLFKHQPSR